MKKTLLASAITLAFGSVLANPVNNSGNPNGTNTQSAAATSTQTGNSGPAANEYSTAVQDSRNQTDNKNQSDNRNQSDNKNQSDQNNTKSTPNVTQKARGKSAASFGTKKKHIPKITPSTGKRRKIFGDLFDVMKYHLPTLCTTSIGAKNMNMILRHRK